MTAICLLSARLNLPQEKLTQGAHAPRLSGSLQHSPSSSLLDIHLSSDKKADHKWLMAASRCSKLSGYYSKLRKRLDMSLRTHNPRSFTASPDFKNTKEQDQGSSAGFAGLESATENDCSGISCFWSPGLAGLCSSTFHSPLRITKTIRREDHVCRGLRGDLLPKVHF